MERVVGLSAELRAELAELEPGRFSPEQAAAITEALALTENACGAAKARLATPRRRVARTGRVALPGRRIGSPARRGRRSGRRRRYWRRLRRSRRVPTRTRRWSPARFRLRRQGRSCARRRRCPGWRRSWSRSPGAAHWVGCEPRRGGAASVRSHRSSCGPGSTRHGPFTTAPPSWGWCGSTRW